VTGLFHVLSFIQRGQFQKAQAARKTVLTKMGLDAKQELDAPSPARTCTRTCTLTLTLTLTPSRSWTRRRSRAVRMG